MLILGLVRVSHTMKYRIKIWLDEFGYRHDNNVNFHFSCEPPEGKYSAYQEISIISEKMRKFSLKENPSDRAFIRISDYNTDDSCAVNYIYLNSTVTNTWTFDYIENGEWTSNIYIPQ